MNIYTYLVSSIFDIITLGFLLVLILNNSIMEKQQANCFIRTICIMVVIIIAEAGTSYCDTQHGIKFAICNTLFNMIGFGVSPLIALTLIGLFHRFRKRFQYLICIPALINAILALTSPLGGFIFHVSADNIYERGPFFWFFVTCYLYELILLIYAIWHNNSGLAINRSLYISSLFLILLIGTTVQIVLPNIHTTWHCATIVLLLFYVFIRENQYKYDPLTQCLNRQAYNIGLAKLEQFGSGAIIMFDVNNFKHVNDSYGHLKGDLCLKRISSIINKSFDTIGDCYRIGGDEFCVITRTTDKDIIHSCLDLILVKVASMQAKDAYMTSVSYGYSIYDGSNQIESYISSADKNMYHVKQKDPA